LFANLVSYQSETFAYILEAALKFIGYTQHID